MTLTATTTWTWTTHVDVAIARGEAMECAASLDVMKLRKVVAPGRYEDGIRLLEGVVAMLTKMI